MGDRITTDVRSLREAQARGVAMVPTAPGEGFRAYGVVISVDDTTSPPTHDVVVCGGPAGAWTMRIVPAVAPFGATIPAEEQVLLHHVPGAGLVCERIADQTGAAGLLEVPNHAHSNANGDGGQTVHGFSY